MLQKCEGIVIRTTDYGETNKIVTLYTREWGKVGVMARGAKRPKSRLAAVTQHFSYGHFVVYRSTGLGTLQQADLISSYRRIREDIFLTAYASYIVELLDRSTQDTTPNPYLFQHLQQTLQYMAEGYDPEIIMNIFEVKMLAVLGITPELTKCVSCSTNEGIFAFSIRKAGIICSNCFSKDDYHLKVSQATIKLLKVFYYFDLSRLGSISVKEHTKQQLRKVIDTYYEEYSGLYLKSKRFLDQIDNLRNSFPDK